jgi:hypothetical protein
MPIFISRGRFTSDAVKGMLAEPENREEAVAKLFQSVGGKLIAWCWPLVSSLTQKLQLLRCWLRRAEAVCLMLRQLLL